jgi:hypothetical protein
VMGMNVTSALVYARGEYTSGLLTHDARTNNVQVDGAPHAMASSDGLVIGTGKIAESVQGPQESLSLDASACISTATGACAALIA